MFELCCKVALTRIELRIGWPNGDGHQAFEPCPSPNSGWKIFDDWQLKENAKVFRF